MIIRNIEINDFNKGYLELLSQLSNTINVESKNKFTDFIKKLNQNHKIIIIEIDNKIVATGTLLIENKIIHNFSKVGHIEDIVVDTTTRGYGLGKIIINYLSDLAKENGCYKVILNCIETNIGFYEKCDFVKKEVQMVKYF